jgi:predicted amidohydrolase
MRASLTIAAAQPACHAHDVIANVQSHADCVRSAAARVVVFPELSLTGYELDAVCLALDDVRLTPLVQACRDAGTIALVGAPIQGESGASHIAMLRVSAEGVAVAYRKVCVCSSEALRFMPGPQPSSLNVDGVRLGLAICRDIGIVEHTAATVALGIDVYVAGVLNHDHEERLQSARARRIAKEHGVHVVFASFAGATGDGYARAAGCSGIWAPDGSVLSQVGPETGAIARASLDCAGR